MAGVKKTPRLRKDGKYYVVGIYKPDGQRTNVSFGPIGSRTEGEIFAAFVKWLDLFRQQPNKVLSFSSPYEAINQIVNPATIVKVGELLDKFETYFRKIKKPVKYGLENPDLRFVKRVRRFMESYYKWPIDEIGPDELLNIQQALMQYEYLRGNTKKKYTRNGINDTINWIHKIWRWGVGRQLVRPELVEAFDEIKPLRMGQSGVYDNHKRSRVIEEEFTKVIQAVNSVVADMLKLIWYTGMRPSEVCDMRPFDIIHDVPKCWLYIPGRDQTPVGHHKTTRYERVKVIPLASKPQEILSQRIKDFDSMDFIFKPEDAMRELLQKRRKNRKTAVSCGNRPGTNKQEHPMIKPGKRYSNDSLCHACKRGCKNAGVDVFVPYDLRRTMATGTRAILGKEAARVLLGHAKTDTTDIYLLEEVQEAIKIAKLLDAKL